MSQRSNIFHYRISAFLSEHGLNDFRFVRRRKHPAVIVVQGDRVIVHAFAGTTSDRRAVENCISDLRHRLGLLCSKPKAANSNRPKRSKGPKRGNRVKRFLKPTVPTDPQVREDNFYAPLAALKARMAGLPDEGGEQRNLDVVR